MTQVSAGAKHSLLLLHSGVVLGAGGNDQNELGSGFGTGMGVFKELKALSHIPAKRIAAGYGHSAVISVSN